jgi:hypothetical protein
MRAPGFTAEETVYKTREAYRMLGTGTLFTGGTAINEGTAIKEALRSLYLCLQLLQ